MKNIYTNTLVIYYKNIKSFQLSRFFQILLEQYQFQHTVSVSYTAEPK